MCLREGGHKMNPTVRENSLYTGEVATTATTDTVNQNSNSPQLPQEIVKLIFSFCDLRTVSMAACSCRTWKAIAEELPMLNFLRRSVSQVFTLFIQTDNETQVDDWTKKECTLYGPTTLINGRFFYTVENSAVSDYGVDWNTDSTYYLYRYDCMCNEAQLITSWPRSLEFRKASTPVLVGSHSVAQFFNKRWSLYSLEEEDVHKHVDEALYHQGYAVNSTKKLIAITDSRNIRVLKEDGSVLFTTTLDSKESVSGAYGILGFTSEVLIVTIYSHATKSYYLNSYALATGKLVATKTLDGMPMHENSKWADNGITDAYIAIAVKRPPVHCFLREKEYLDIFDARQLTFCLSIPIPSYIMSIRIADDRIDIVGNYYNSQSHIELKTFDIKTGALLKDIDVEDGLKSTYMLDGYAAIHVRGGVNKESHIELWDIRRGQRVHRLTSTIGNISRIFFQKDGQNDLLMAASDDGKVQMWSSQCDGSPYYLCNEEFEPTNKKRKVDNFS